MSSTVKQFGALDPSGPSPDGHGHASAAARRTASGSGMGDWLVNVRGDVVVPMTTSEIVEGLRAAKLSERSLVWRLGMLDWIVLGDVPQLRLASGAALSSAPPPASARVVSARAAQPPTEVQAESQRRRNTLPFGFPAARDSASVRQPSGFRAPSPAPAPAPAPLAKPLSAPRAATVPRPSVTLPVAPVAPVIQPTEESFALAVYERPVASLTFSDSVAAEWRGEPRPASEPPPPSSAPAARATARKLTPLPAPSAPLSLNASMPHSLAPTTFEAQGAIGSRPPSAYADLSVVLAADFRAAKASSRRLAVFGALGSALFASAITVCLMRTPSPELPTPAAQPVAVQPVPAAAAAPPLVAVAAPSPVPVPVKAKPAAPRVPRAPLRARVKPVPRPAPTVSSSEPAVSDNPYPANDEPEPSAVATPDRSPASDGAPAPPSGEPSRAPAAAREAKPSTPATDAPGAP